MLKTFARGRLINDSEVFTTAGATGLKFTMSCEEYGLPLNDKEKEYGRKQGSVLVNCVIWNAKNSTVDRASMFKDRLKKGSHVLAEGLYYPRAYIDKVTGAEKTAMNMRIDNFECTDNDAPERPADPVTPGKNSLKKAAPAEPVVEEDPGFDLPF